MKRLRWYRDRAIRILRYDGWVVLPYRILVRSLSPLGKLGVRVFYEVDLSGKFKETRPKVDLGITRASEDDIPHLATFERAKDVREVVAEAERQRVSVEEILRRRIRRGDVCFIARVGEEIVHTNWIALPGTTGQLGLFSPHMQQDEAYTYNGHTATRWRGKAIHAAVVAHMLAFLREESYRKAYAQARWENKASWISHERMGWTRSGTVLFFQPRGSKVFLVWRLRGRLAPYFEREARFLIFRKGEETRRPDLPRYTRSF